MKNKIILTILLVGIIYKLALTWGGNFLFHIDSARDMVDVREMVVLGKLRLTGPNAAIEGLFNGPAWYYILAVPFIISGGDPYAAIILQILMWAFGGFFLLKLVSKWSVWLVIPIGLVWIASNYISLSTVYAFNPTPVTLLTPIFIYLLYKYLETKRLIFVILTFFLGGLFFNFEMNFGIFVPIIILFAIIFSKNLTLLKTIKFWIGAFFYIICLSPQILFDFRHGFIMSKAILAHLDKEIKPFNFFERIKEMMLSFYNVFVPTILNRKLLSIIIIISFVPILYKFLKTGAKDKIVLITSLYIFIPFIGFLVLPVVVNPWHLGGPMSASLILIAYLLKQLHKYQGFGKILSVTLTSAIILFAVLNIARYFLIDKWKPNMDPSLYKNEIAAIDYVYKYADGKNFKVYTYLPSIIDYPYQYLIWWHGLKKYGYLPMDYAYQPQKSEYISNKKSFSASDDDLKKREDSNLVFLIKEPNRNYTRFGWEGDFIKYNWETVGKQVVGLIEIEIRREFKK